MLYERVFEHHAVDIATCHVTADLEGRTRAIKSEFLQKGRTPHSDYFSHPKTLPGVEFPFQVSVKSPDVYSPWDIDALSEVIDVLQRTLDAVKDGAHDSRPELHREGFPRPEDRVTDGHTGCGIRLR